MFRCNNEDKRRSVLKKFDLFSESSGITVECKHDLMSKKTGNVAIEVFNPKSKELSGLYATTSKLWAHIVYDKLTTEQKFLLCQTDELKKFVESTEPIRFVKWGGDGNSSMKLYKVEQLESKNGGPFVHISDLDCLKNCLTKFSIE